MSDLLDLVLDAHGGLENWRSTTTIDMRLSIRGDVMWIKGHPDGLRNVLVKIDTRAPWVSISPAPHQGSRAIFDRGTITIQNDRGEVQATLSEPRQSYDGHVRETPWTDIQFSYFFAYAFWNYFTTPFLLASNGVVCVEAATHDEHGEKWRVLKATFDKSVDTHCAEQTFYFSNDGLLRRHDYHTDLGKGRVGHYVFDHRKYDGFVFPTHRRVVPRDESGKTKLTALSSFIIDIDFVVITKALSR